MTTFVLVHGAWGGSYGFRYVRRPLREAGHEVFTPSLTGIGERAHLASPQVNLSTHVTDVVNTILYEDLTDIVLLGYSYGGMVVTGALEHVADRVSHLVYLDAFKPADGQSLTDLTGAPYRAPASGRAARGWSSRCTGRFEDDSQVDWFSRAALLAPGRLLHRAGPAGKPLEEYPFTRTYVKALQEPRAAAGTGASAFWRAADTRRPTRPGGTARSTPTTDPDQPPGRAYRAAA